MDVVNMGPGLFSGSRRILWLLFAVSLVFLGFFVFYDDQDYKRGLSVNRTTSYIEGLRIVNKKNGADSWVLTARRADFTRDETLAKLDAVAMDIRKEGVVLNADSGVYNVSTRELQLDSNVTLKTKDSVIHARNLFWNPATGILTSAGKVRMEGRKFRLEGEGLSATKDDKVRFTRNVKATFF
ncbi:MAG: LPS export ABC transporter periplasmic protein LptC [Nitrospirae bacterium]|nr:LPS export ABC transporter periplasmic protein LptC [Nitrospirota bacterium]